MSTFAAFRVILIAAEAVAIFLGAQLVIAALSDGQGPALPLIVLASLSGAASVWLVDHLEMPQQRARALVALVTLLITLILLRIEYAQDVFVWDFRWLTSFVEDPDAALSGNGHLPLGAITLALAWFRGVQREADEVLPEEAVKELAWAFVVAGCAVVLARPFDAGNDVYAAAVLFLALALAALALAQVADLQQPLAFRWAGSSLATTGVLVGVGGVLAFAFALAWGPLEEPLRDAFGAVALIVLTALVMPFVWAFELVDWITGGTIRIDPNALQNIPQDTQQRVAEEPRQLSDGERAIGAGMRALIVLVGALAIGGFVYWMARRYQRLKRQAPPQSPVASKAGSPLDDARGLLGLLRNLRGRDRASRGNIYGLYEWVLDEAAERGQPRPPGVTPGEFLPQVQRMFQGPVTADITRTYERARYGSVYPSRAEVEGLVRQWQATLKAHPPEPARG
jgi:hypothetical protein